MTVGDYFVCHSVDVLQCVAPQVLKLELEPAEAPDAVHGRRFKSDYDCSRNAKQFWRDASDNVAGGVSFAFALVDGP